jgi:transposase
MPAGIFLRKDKNEKRNRNIIDLYLTGSTYDEIAYSLNITRNVVAGLIHRYKE